jgi:hypothetical protein
MNPLIQLKRSVVCPRERLTKTKILRNIFLSVGVLFALTRLMAAGSADGVSGLDKTPFVPPHSTFITFDPPGSTLTLPSAITASGTIIGSYTDASGAEHGFLRTRGGVFTTFDVPGSTSTTATSITPGGVITGWYSDTIGNVHGFLRARRKHHFVRCTTWL